MRKDSLIYRLLVRVLRSLFLVCLLANKPIEAQSLPDYTLEGDLRYEDKVYQEGILSVQLHPIGDDLSMPIIPLQGGATLQLSFDDLYEDFAQYSYKIIHCDHHWRPSDLLVTDYLSNFQEFDIQDFTYSINALIPYTHYQLTLPNQNLRFSKSGNYLLVVYRDDDPNNLVLSRRFMVYEELTNISGQIKRATAVELMDSHQEVDFTIYHPNYEIPNPFRDLNVYLLQNQRWDNAITDLKPRFMRQGALVYNYDLENTFPGGNEYRFFDTKTLLNLGQNVAKVTRDDAFTAYLKTSEAQNSREYSVLFDINGQYRIRRLDATNSATTADYAYVDFALLHTPALTSSDVYVFGELSDWQLLPRFKLQYDEARMLYRSQILLKQGFYNYAFVTRDDQTGGADFSTFEGNFWETENTYQILVYNRDVGARYDRLVGYSQFSSEALYNQ